MRHTKQLLLLLFTLLALAAGARATDVTISATTLPNFNDPRAGVDVSLTISVTNGQAAATCASCLPGTLVGIPGAILDIAGVRYSIASSVDRSNFTLTTAYAGATNPVASAVLRKWVQLRFYVSAPFVPSGAAAPIQAGSDGSNTWFKRIACSVTSDGLVNSLNIPEVVLPATLDGSPASSLYTASFYDSGGARIDAFGGLARFSLPSASPTSWATIFALNNPSPPFAGLPGTGFFAQTAPLSFALRTLTGTANEVAVANGDGTGVPTFSLPSSLTFTGKTITGGAYSSPALTTPTIGGFAASLGGNLTTAGAFTTSGANALTLTTTGSTNVTLPPSGTLATLAGSETFTNKTVKGYPRIIEVNTTTVGNVGGGADNLHSFTLPSGSLANDGDMLEVTYSGAIAGNDNDKTLLTLFDGQGVEDTSARDVDDSFNAGWQLTTYYTRVSATQVRAVSLAYAGFLFVDSAGSALSSGSYFVQRNKLLTVSNLNSNSVVLLVQGTGTADNDITQNFSVVKLVQR
jgi:hypothetical protein